MRYAVFFVRKPARYRKKYVRDSISNSIIDTGTNFISLANDVYKHIIKSLKIINPEFIEMIKESDIQDTGLNAKKLNLAEGPLINFVFSGEGRKDIKLTCTSLRINQKIRSMAIKNPPFSEWIFSCLEQESNLHILANTRF